MKATARIFTAAALAVSSVLIVVGTSATGAPRPVSVDIPVDFNRDVRPILSEHCFPCHGPDKEATAKTGGYRLDNFDEATRDLGGYFGIKPGSIEDSFLVERIDAEIPELRMPPENSIVKPLTEEQRQTLRSWIAQGAKYDKHWSFQTPKRPALPQVENWGWIRNPIDRFVLKRLTEDGHRPAPEADRAVLLRRAYLALTGLPPSIDELDAYLADTKPDAYERMVDRLLASPSYGEHQARFWMDAVRYGDTHGLHFDNERSVWPYRDWVVRAFNEDLPYDDFVTWQLAGDMLEEPTLDQQIASGYIRLHTTTNEGGVIAAEFQAKNTFDRVETSGTVFMGLTIGCARCHDHRYDPITQEEYYGLYAFFNSTVENPLDGNLLLPAPVIRAPSPEQSALMAALAEEQAKIESELSLSKIEAWASSSKVTPIQIGSWHKSEVYVAANFEAARTTNFGPETGSKEVVWTQTEVQLGTPIASVVGKENAAVYFKTEIQSPADQQIELRLGSDDSIRVWQNGTLVHDNNVSRGLVVDNDIIKVSLVKGRNELIFKIINGIGPDGFYAAFGDRRRETIESALALLAKPKIEETELLAVKRAYLEYGPEDDRPGIEWRELGRQAAELETQVPSTMVAQETEEPRPAMLLARGEYDHPKQQVKRSIPAALGELPPTGPQNRLGLAQWLTQQDNPLAARVFVNRVWQQYFGAGLVKTSEDFGSQGEWPSHPELLDWLSREFVDNGWSVKDLHRSIVLSAAFRQNAAATAAKTETDPDNRLISRGPRFRMDAEVIRDQALFLSGLLVQKQGGKGVKPYQPGGLWEAVGLIGPDGNTSNTRIYVQDSGEGLYRRSLYSFWKRTSPPASLVIFDAPTREACIVRRSRTNTPLQALAVMNDPQFVEASREFAGRVMSGEQTETGRVRLAFRMATSRLPNDGETKILLRMLRSEKSRFMSQPENAASLLSIGDSTRDETLAQADQAAWTVVCSMLLNLDEVLTIH
jgi:hypothetical protein